MSLPKSTKTVIEAGLKEFGDRVGVTDQARCLELMVAQYTGQEGLIQAIVNASQRLKGARTIGSSGLSAEECLEKVYAIVDESILELATSLEVVQNLETFEQ